MRRAEQHVAQTVVRGIECASDAKFPVFLPAKESPRPKNNSACSMYMTTACRGESVRSAITEGGIAFCVSTRCVYLV